MVWPKPHQLEQCLCFCYIFVLKVDVTPNKNEEQSGCFVEKILKEYYDRQTIKQLCCLERLIKVHIHSYTEQYIYRIFEIHFNNAVFYVNSFHTHAGENSINKNTMVLHWWFIMSPNRKVQCLVLRSSATSTCFFYNQHEFSACSSWYCCFLICDHLLPMTGIPIFSHK